MASRESSRTISRERLELCPDEDGIVTCPDDNQAEPLQVSDSEDAPDGRAQMINAVVQQANRGYKRESKKGSGIRILSKVVSGGYSPSNTLSRQVPNGSNLHDRASGRQCAESAQSGNRRLYSNFDPLSAKSPRLGVYDPNMPRAPAQEPHVSDFFPRPGTVHITHKAAPMTPDSVGAAFPISNAAKTSRQGKAQYFLSEGRAPAVLRQGQKSASQALEAALVGHSLEPTRSYAEPQIVVPSVKRTKSLSSGHQSIDLIDSDDEDKVGSSKRLKYGSEPLELPVSRLWIGKQCLARDHHLKISPHGMALDVVEDDGNSFTEWTLEGCLSIYWKASPLRLLIMGKQLKPPRKLRISEKAFSSAAEGSRQQRSVRLEFASIADVPERLRNHPLFSTWREMDSEDVHLFRGGGLGHQTSIVAQPVFGIGTRKGRPGTHQTVAATAEIESSSFYTGASAPASANKSLSRNVSRESSPLSDLHDAPPDQPVRRSQRITRSSGRSYNALRRKSPDRSAEEDQATVILERHLRERFWDRSKELFVYPFSGSNQVTVYPTDAARLANWEFLNDAVLEFYLRHLVELLPDWQRSKVHLFNSFFYRRLTEGISMNTMNKAEESDCKGYARVQKWAKNVDLFSKRMIIVPINEHLHWFLAVIVNPGNMIDSQPEKSSEPASSARVDDSAIEGKDFARDPAVDFNPTDAGGDSADIAGVPCRSDTVEGKDSTGENGAEEQDSIVITSGEPVVEKEGEMASIEKDAVGPSPMDVGNEAEEEPIRSGPTSPVAEAGDSGFRFLQPTRDEYLQNVENAIVDMPPMQPSASGEKRYPKVISCISDSDDEIVPGNHSAPASFRPHPPSKRYPSRTTRNSGGDGFFVLPSPSPRKRAQRPANPIEDQDPDQCTAIFVLDSLGSSKRKPFSALESYLRNEANRRNLKLRTDAKAVHINADVPTQTNSFDCGIFLLHYVERLLEKPDDMIRALWQDAKRKGRRGNSSQRDSLWKQADIEDKRVAIMTLILETAHKYYAVRESQPRGPTDDEDEDEIVIHDPTTARTPPGPRSPEMKELNRPDSPKTSFFQNKVSANLDAKEEVDLLPPIYPPTPPRPKSSVTTPCVEVPPPNPPMAEEFMQPSPSPRGSLSRRGKKFVPCDDEADEVAVVLDPKASVIGGGPALLDIEGSQGEQDDEIAKYGPSLPSPTPQVRSNSSTKAGKGAPSFPSVTRLADFHDEAGQVSDRRDFFTSGQTPPPAAVPSADVSMVDLASPPQIPSRPSEESPQQASAASSGFASSGSLLADDSFACKDVISSVSAIRSPVEMPKFKGPKFPVDYLLNSHPSSFPDLRVGELDSERQDLEQPLAFGAKWASAIPSHSPSVIMQIGVDCNVPQLDSVRSEQAVSSSLAAHLNHGSMEAPDPQISSCGGSSTQTQTVDLLSDSDGNGDDATTRSARQLAAEAAERRRTQEQKAREQKRTLRPLGMTGLSGSLRVHRPKGKAGSATARGTGFGRAGSRGKSGCSPSSDPKQRSINDFCMKATNPGAVEALSPTEGLDVAVPFTDSRPGCHSSTDLTSDFESS